jgi:hypothetical protein
MRVPQCCTSAPVQNCSLETIERARFAVHHNLKSLVIVVAASFTCRHLPTCTLQALASSTDKQRVLKQLGYLVKLLAGIEQLKQL